MKKQKQYGQAQLLKTVHNARSDAQIKTDFLKLHYERKWRLVSKVDKDTYFEYTFETVDNAEDN